MPLSYTPRTRSVLDKAKVQELHGVGYDVFRIARATGYKPESVRASLIRNGITPHPARDNPFTRTEKKCCRCQTVKPLSDFASDRRQPDGHASLCKDPCLSLNNRSRKYGISPEQAQALLEKGCSICGSFKSLTIDHNHSTGQVRAALCARCNGMLAGVEDTEFRAKALNYLELYT